MSNLLEIKNLSAGTEDKEILHDVNLTIKDSTCHVLMGPNGAGKSTLGHVIAGDPVYKNQSGSISLNGEDITSLSADKRSIAGIFLSFQAPVEIPGVPLYSFLRTIAGKRPELKMGSKAFKAHIAEIAEELDMDTSYLTRDLGVGFSGGEKKKIEMLQLLLLKPKLAILDETDSGLDVDALSVVRKGIAKYRELTGGALLIITHNARLLDGLAINKTHIMVDGALVDEGGSELVAEIDKCGFEKYEG